MRINIWVCGLVLVSRFPIPLKARKRKQKQVLLKNWKRYGSLAMFLRIFFGNYLIHKLNLYCYMDPILENENGFTITCLLWKTSKSISKNTNNMVYGETGRTPLHLDAKVCSVCFWLRLMRMEAERLPRKAYNILVNVHNNRRQCWVSAVQRNLMMGGSSGYVWANQGVQNVNCFCVHSENF